MSALTDLLRQEGVLLATTPEGYELPVIDVTHGRFAVPEDPASLEALRRTFMEHERQHARMPRFLMRWTLGSAARKSRFLRGAFKPGATFLNGLDPKRTQSEPAWWR